MEVEPEGGTAPPSIVLACPGLDHARRGFETFARECFTALHGRPDLRVALAKGSGAPRSGELVVPTLRRDRVGARLLARLTSREPFIVEHVAFALAFASRLNRLRPGAVYFSEWHVGLILAAWRRVSRHRFALVFCNGALAARRYRLFDRVQQLVPGAIEYTLERGEPSQIQELLPLGVAMPSEPPQLDRDGSLRRRLGLPEEKRIVMSVGAINRQKRMDYLIEEVASMPEPRPFLLLVGEEEPDTAAMRRLARRRLGADGHDIRTVPGESMADHYEASDAFVLASLWESFGRVLVEAQSHGLPCLAHDYPVMRWILGDEGDTADLTRPGSLTAWLANLSDADLSEASRQRRHRAAYQRFSWDMLADRYAEMLRTVAEAQRL